MNPDGTTRRARQASQAARAAGKLVLTYAAFSFLWILLSDKAVEFLFADLNTIVLVSLLKGWLFVAITALLLYLLARRLFTEIQAHASSAREAQTERQRTDQLLAAIVDSSSDVIFAKDLAGRYLLFNREGGHAVGRSPESIIGKDDHAILPAEQAAQLRSQDQEVIAQGRLCTFESTLSTAQGERVYSVIKGPLRDEANRIVGVFGISRDITERKRIENELRRNEANLRKLFDDNTSVMLLVDQSSGRIIDANMAASRLYGYPREQLMQMGIEQINTLPPERIAEERQRAANGERKIFYFSHRLASGEIRDVEIHTTPRERNGRPSLLSIIHDITQRKLAEEKLRESEERLRLAFTASNQGWFDVDLRSGEIRVSPEYARMIGYEPDELHSDLQNWLNNIHPDERDTLLAALEDCIAGTAPCSMEYRRRSKSGDWRWIRSIGKVVQWDEKQRPLRMIGIHTDITERKEMEEQIRQLAFFDPLTNRRLLNDRLSRAMAISKRSGRYCALMFADLDNFKPLNDKHGHEAGDLLLIEVAERLSKCVREADTVARFGGDEFVIMIGELDVSRNESVAQARVVAEKIRVALARPYLLAAQAEDGGIKSIEHHCSASIGVALFINHEASQGDVLKAADIAMYAAKEAGRNQIRFHEEASPAANSGS
jgi:diguanylate cyclase (GGDEF)-like protein/PAS domain S-box-containing protein